MVLIFVMIINNYKIILDKNLDDKQKEDYLEKLTITDCKNIISNSKNKKTKNSKKSETNNNENKTSDKKSTSTKTTSKTKTTTTTKKPRTTKKDKKEK